MLFKSLFLILSYECVPVTRLVEPVLVIDTGLARLDFAYLAHPPLLTSTLGQRALLDTQLFQYLVVVLHAVLAGSMIWLEVFLAASATWTNSQAVESLSTGQLWRYFHARPDFKSLCQ